MTWTPETHACAKRRLSDGSPLSLYDQQQMLLEIERLQGIVDTYQRSCPWCGGTIRIVDGHEVCDSCETNWTESNDDYRRSHAKFFANTEED